VLYNPANRADGNRKARFPTLIGRPLASNRAIADNGRTRLIRTGATSAIKRCFIAAPVGARLDELRTALESRGVRVLVPHELAVGTDWASEIQKQILQADLVVGVLTSERESPWVLFELGQASALGRRILLITSPDAERIPFALHQLLVLRIDLDNREAIEFALDQVLSAPQQPRREPIQKSIQMAGLGSKADELIAVLEQSLASNDWLSIEHVVADALRSSGTDVVVTSPARDVGADFAVWSDVLEPFVGNPLLVEVKTKIRDRASARSAIIQITKYLGESGSRWALLLYGDGPSSDDPAWWGGPPNVLIISLRSLLEALRTQAFPELVRDLRNRRVHGSIS
jgi:TIR domain